MKAFAIVSAFVIMLTCFIGIRLSAQQPAKAALPSYSLPANVVKGFEPIIVRREAWIAEGQVIAADWRKEMTVALATVDGGPLDPNVYTIDPKGQSAIPLHQQFQNPGQR